MSHLEEIFLQATNRNEALSTLFWEKKKAPKPAPSTLPEAPIDKEEPETLPATEIRESREIPEKEVEEEEIVYEIDDADIVEVVSDALEIEEGAPTPDSEVEELEVEEIGEQSLTEKEWQKFCSIKSRKIMDGEFMIFCKNTVTGKHYTAVVENIGLGGLFMTLSPPRVSEGEELILEGRIGTQFKFRERAVLHSRHQGKFVFEFVDLSSETTCFLNRLKTS